MIKTLFPIFLMAISTSLFSQIVTGRVIDAKSKEPIKDAKVIVEKTRQLTTSNHLGYFQSVADSADYLTINANGYESSLIKIPNQESFAVGLKEIEEVWTIVEEPASPIDGFESFFKSIKKNLDCPYHEKADTMLITFTINQTGDLNVEKILKSSGINCDDEISQILKTTSKWNSAKQRGEKVKQKFELLLLYANNKPELRFLPATTNNLWFYLLRNFSSPLENQTGIEAQRFYVFVDLEKGNLKNIKLLNHEDSKTGSFLIQVIQNAPYQLIADLNPSQSQIIIPISLKFNEQQTFQDKLILPTGELISEFSYTIRKNAR